MQDSHRASGFWLEIVEEAKKYPSVYNEQVKSTKPLRSPGSCNVIVTGSGDSYAAALTGSAMAGQPGLAVDPLSLLRYAGGGWDGVVIAVSLGGRTRAVLEAARRYKERGGTVVAVTGREDSPLASLADMVVPVAAERYVRGSGFSTYIAMTAAVAALLGATRETSRYPETGLEWRITGRPVYVGSGPYAGLALFLALKHYELFAEPVRSYQLEQFLHAPVFSVTQAETVVLLGRSSDHDLDVAGILGSQGFNVFNAMRNGGIEDVFISQAMEATLWLASQVRRRGLEEPSYRSRRNTAWTLARVIYT